MIVYGCFTPPSPFLFLLGMAPIRLNSLKKIFIKERYVQLINFNKLTLLQNIIDCIFTKIINSFIRYISY